MPLIDISGLHGTSVPLVWWNYISLPCVGGYLGYHYFPPPGVLFGVVAKDRCDGVRDG